MNVIGTELPELSDFVYTLSSAYIDQSAPNMGKIFMSNRILMSSIMGPIGVVWSCIVKNFCIRLCLLSNIYKYKPISTKICHNDYQMSLIMGQVIPDQLVFSVLEIEKLNFSSLFGIYLHC